MHGHSSAIPSTFRDRKRKPLKALTAVDLFCGCGGLTQGLKQAKFKVIGAVELNSLAAETFRQNHPNIHIEERDIRKVSVARFMEEIKVEKGSLDLLAGCPPCQGFSTLTTMNGAKVIGDKRNDLVYEFLRFVRQLKPKAIMMENVPGLAKDERMTVLLKKLKSLGYSCRVEVLDAADFAVPQRRKRMILVGGLTGEPRQAKVARVRKTVFSAIGSLPRPGKGGDKLHSPESGRSKSIRTRIRAIPKDGGSRSSLPHSLQLPCHKRSDGFKDVYGRMAWQSVAPTITGGCINPSKGRFLHPTQNRAITLREAALLQTFPKRYKFPLTSGKFAVALMIGNALPPEFIRRHASSLHEYILNSNK